MMKSPAPDDPSWGVGAPTLNEMNRGAERLCAAVGCQEQVAGFPLSCLVGSAEPLNSLGSSCHPQEGSSLHVWGSFLLGSPERKGQEKKARIPNLGLLAFGLRGGGFGGSQHKTR